MHALNRRGFTLIELLIALVIGAVVGTATVKVLVGMQRTTAAGMPRAPPRTRTVRASRRRRDELEKSAAGSVNFRMIKWKSQTG